MLAESSDKDPLSILNRLRQLETRKPLQTLPSLIRSFDSDRLKLTIKYWEDQIQIHEELQAKSTEYNNRIILNETEQQLYAINKRFPDRNTNFLKFKQIAIPDKKLYFPHGLEEPDKLSFITDTKAIYIQSLAVVTLHDRNICLAKHSIPDCITFVPGPAELTLKAGKRLRAEVDTTNIVTTKLRSGKSPKRAVVTPPKSKQVIPKQPDDRPIRRNLFNDPSLENNFQKTLSSEAHSTSILQGEELQDNLPDFDEVKSSFDIYKGSLHNNLQTNTSPGDSEVKEEVKIDYSKIIVPPIVTEPDKFKNSPKKEIPLKKSEPSPLKKPPIEREVEMSNPGEEPKAIEALIDALIKKHMELNLQRPRQPPSTPPIEGDENDVEFLRKKLEILEATHHPSRHMVSTDTQTIMDLKSNMAEMANCINKLQEVIEENKLTPEEKQKLKLMSGPTSTAVNSLVYKIDYPKNVIDITVFRPSISIMKPTSIIATVGVFDPDSNPKSNFREIWERIQNYTRNYELYEYEYVDILMIVMKGSAGSSLTDMIREYNGKLYKILEAIQDIYIPQHTIFDDMDALNKFSRPANENIKSTMRRAALIINKLKNQCTPAAWNERRYHLLLALIKQVIDKDTARHLYAEELKCAQRGAQLDIPAIITIISLHEQTHDLIPKREMKLHYDINSMQVIENKDQPVKTMTVADKNEKRSQQHKKERSKTKELIRTPDKRSESRDRISGKKYGDERNDRLRNRSSSVSSLHNYSQRNSQGERNYRSTSPYNDKQRSRSNDRSQSRDRYRSLSRDRSYGQKSNSSNKNQDRSRKQGRDNNNKNNRKSYKNGNGNKPRYEKTFEHGKNLVTLHFYKCLTCPSMHPTGANCDNNNKVTSLNM